MKRDFLRLSDLSLAEHRALFSRARELKELRKRKQAVQTLLGRTLALLFEKPSTRTRLSFEAAMRQLDGSTTTLSAVDSQISRGETIADTARVTSRYVDCIMFRTFGDDRLAELAKHSTVPVINGLSDGAHPVQLLADVFTIEERLGPIAGRTVAFVGDGASNMARSFIEASHVYEFTLRIGCPDELRPPEADVKRSSGVTVSNDPHATVRGADVVVTDVWTSMGQEAEAARRRTLLEPFRVDEALVQRAGPNAIVLHCLPAHRGEEITDAVIDGAQSAAWDEAENRMHVQKALLEKLILG